MENIEEELKTLKEKHLLTKEYLRRSLLILKKSIEFFDIEIDESDEFDEKIIKFVREVKRKNLV